MNGFKINNLPKDVKETAYIVCSMVNDELWFYGAYNNKEKAEEVAEMYDGLTVIH